MDETVFGGVDGSDQVVVFEAGNAENVARLVACSLKGDVPVTIANTYSTD